MNLREEQMWAEIVEASLPNPAELAAAEAELRAIEPVEPLPPAMVDAVVDRATATAEAEETPHEAPVYAFSQRKKMLLAAALLLVSVSGIAWAFMNQAWSAKRLAPHTLDYAKAVQVATEPGLSKRIRMQAILRIDEHCSSIAHALHQLQRGADSALREQARKACTELVAVLEAGATETPIPTDPELQQRLTELLDEDRPSSERAKLLEHVVNQARHGLNALMLARQFYALEGLESFDITLRRLAGELRG
jgi:hypothetical protein